MTGPLAEVINRAKFYLNRFRDFNSVGETNFWLPHMKEKSPLTQGLNYRSTCRCTMATFYISRVTAKLSFSSKKKYFAYVYNVRKRCIYKTTKMKWNEMARSASARRSFLRARASIATCSYSAY